MSDGVTVFKVNSKSNKRIEVGYLALNGKLMFNKPKNLLVATDITTYRLNFEIPSYDSCSIKSDSREVLVKEGNHTWSIGYFDNGKLVLWDQYIN